LSHTKLRNAAALKKIPTIWPVALIPKASVSVEPGASRVVKRPPASRNPCSAFVAVSR